jgi:hypothetical protein
MSDMTGLKSFVTTLAGHIAAETAMTKKPRILEKLNKQI